MKPFDFCPIIITWKANIMWSVLNQLLYDRLAARFGKPDVVNAGEAPTGYFATVKGKREWRTTSRGESYRIN